VGGIASPAAAEPPRLDARAWVLVDGRTGEMLAGRAVGQRAPVASATKLMTAYVALRELPLRKVVRAAPYAALPVESLLGLDPGEKVSVRDLLYGLILRSGNDAAHTLAGVVAGSEMRFVRKMNLRAAALGLSQTHFSNPIGLDEPGNYSSAGDLVALSRRLLDIPAFARLARSRRAVLRSLRPPRTIVTRNTLLFRAPWATGVKTGHTLGAGYVLVGSGRRKGVELVSAVLGAPSETDRDLDTISLLEYGFSLYRQRRPLRAGQELAAPDIRYSGGELPLRAARGVTVGVRRGQELSVRVEAPQEVEGPLGRGRVLGSAVVYVDGRRAAEVALVASRSLAAASGFDKVRSFVEENWTILAIGGFVILIAAAFLRRRHHRTKEGEEMDRLKRDQRRAARERERIGGGRW
jgi:D-alanyl-D-alanine carboxypeptidase (penicillin-binding protein 5/6)